MYVDFTPGQQALREELAEYLGALIGDDLFEEMRSNSEGGGPVYKRILRQLGEDRWLGVGWPEEMGGRGLSPIEQYLFAEEISRIGYPFPFLTINTVSPTILHFGTEEQRQEFLPSVLRGECHFAIGYSEPDAGTDLASLKTRAVRDGDEYVISGNKVWTSQAEYADYIWVAARTDPDAPKHRGISMFLVPTDAPGYKCTPIWTMAGVRTNATYFEGVRVPATNLIGQENHGWSLVTGQLNRERISLVNVSGFESILLEVTRHARDTKLADGRRIIDQPWVRQHLGRCKAQIEVLKLMNWKQAWAQTHGQPHPAEASTAKVYGTEMAVRVYEWMMEVIGQRSIIQRDSPAAVLAGRLERMYRSALILTFGGGTNEVQRDIIAMAGLGLPNYKH